MTTKEALLKELEENRGVFISGSAIADTIGVSGTAVWKAARSLKKDGYDIEAVTNRGYRLAERSDILSAREIQRCYKSILEKRSSCSGQHCGHHRQLFLEYFDSIGSTNDICKNRASHGQEEVYVAVASQQTNGRGRMGRSFFSPGDTGLYLSILLRPGDIPGRDSLRFTTMAAVAVAEAIDDVSGRHSGIKWVNDIYINDHKVCGILTEASFSVEGGTLECAVIGIGVNVREPDGGFPQDIRDIAGAVCSRDEQISRSMLAARIIERFMYYYRSGDFAEVREKYRSRCFILGRDITVLKNGGRELPATAADIDDECHLIVRYADGSTETLSSGEISIRL